MLAARSRKARTNARGAASREQILRAAIELLQEKGYSGLSIAGICERADIAPTSLYWHFGNKAGLMGAVLERIGGGGMERIREEVSRADTPAARLDVLIAALGRLTTTQPLGTLTGVAILGEGRHVTPELRDALRDAREREIEVVAREFEQALGIAEPEGEPFAIVIMACANYAALTWRVTGDRGAVDRVLAGLRSALVRMAGAGA